MFDWPKPVRFEASLNGNQLVVRFDEEKADRCSISAPLRCAGSTATWPIRWWRPITAASRSTSCGRSACAASRTSSAVIDMVDQLAGTAAAARRPLPSSRLRRSLPLRSPPLPSPPLRSTPSPERRSARRRPGRRHAGSRNARRRGASSSHRSPPQRCRCGSASMTISRGCASTGRKRSTTRSRARAVAPRSRSIDRPRSTSARCGMLLRAVAEPALLDNGGGLSFNIPRTAQLRHFRSGPSVVVDVLAPPGAAPVAAASAAASPPSPVAPLPLAVQASGCSGAFAVVAPGGAWFPSPRRPRRRLCSRHRRRRSARRGRRPGERARSRRGQTAGGQPA